MYLHPLKISVLTLRSKVLKKVTVVQLNFLGQTAASGCGFPTFRELVLETSENLYNLTRLSVRQTFIELCRRESLDL